MRDDVLLLVTELVTNAVRHAGVGPEGSLQIEVRLWPQRVRVDVTDPGIWGVGRGLSGTCVWFEVDFER